MSLAKSIGPALIATLTASQAFADTAFITVEKDDAIQMITTETKNTEHCLAQTYVAAQSGSRTTATSACMNSDTAEITYYFCGSSWDHLPKSLKGCREMSGPELVGN